MSISQSRSSKTFGFLFIIISCAAFSVSLFNACTCFCICICSCSCICISCAYLTAKHAQWRPDEDVDCLPSAVHLIKHKYSARGILVLLLLGFLWLFLLCSARAENWMPCVGWLLVLVGLARLLGCLPRQGIPISFSFCLGCETCLPKTSETQLNATYFEEIFAPSPPPPADRRLIRGQPAAICTTNFTWRLLQLKYRCQFSYNLLTLKINLYSLIFLV